MVDRLPSPPDRYEELAEAAHTLIGFVAIAGIVCGNVSQQTAPYRVPANAEGFTDLLLTPLQVWALNRAVLEMESAAEKMDDILRRHDA